MKQASIEICLQMLVASCPSSVLIVSFINCIRLLLLSELTKLQDSLHEDLKHAARGALWEIGQNVPSPDIASRSGIFALLYKIVVVEVNGCML